MKLADFLKKENNNLDIIRLFCALLVIYGHIPSCFAYYEPFHFDIFSKIVPFAGGYCGHIAVLTFFFISGLLVGNSLFTKRSIKDFVISRFFRIYPGLIAVLLISVVICKFFSLADMHSYIGYAKDYIVSNLTLHFKSGIESVIFSHVDLLYNSSYMSYVNGPLWTIPIEIMMYIGLLGLFMFCSSVEKFQKPLITIGLITGVLSPYIFNHYLINGAVSTGFSYITLLIPSFCFGSLFALYKEYITLDWKLPLGLYLLGFIFSHHCVSWFLLTMSVVLFLVYIASFKYVRMCHLKYDISYGVYLYGWIVTQIVASTTTISNYFIFLFIVIALSLCVGYLSCVLVERPAMVLKNKLFYKK